MRRTSGPRSLLLGALLACHQGAPPPPPPARADRPLREADLARVTLTSEAERRLDVERHVGTVARRQVRRLRTLGGEVVPVPGRAAQIVAPLAGTVRPPGSAPLPAAGARVTAGQALCGLAPFLSPVERLQIVAAQAEAADQLARAEAQVEAAEAALKRTEDLLAAGSVGERVLEDARARRGTAQAALLAAKIRRNGLTGTGATRPDAAVAPLVIAAPFGGALREVRAAPGQQVPQGAVLFDLVDDDPIWIRVPVSAVEVEEIDAGKEAQVSGLRAAEGAMRAAARPVRPAPPAANSLALTVDLFYQADNPKATLRPGQRVAVALPLRGEEEALTLPAAAILHDIHGGTWVYERTAPQVYVRRRVRVEDIRGDLALLEASSAPATGARIVTAGAIELFAVELGVGK